VVALGKRKPVARRSQGDALSRDRFRPLVLCLTFSCPMSAHAADADGIVMVWLGQGAGAIECPQVVSFMTRARVASTGSLEYSVRTQGFMNFLAGFQTAYNMQTTDTCDIFSGITAEQALEWAENWCRANPSQNFGISVSALARDRYPQRSTACH
jgi:hypothetical protein